MNFVLFSLFAVDLTGTLAGIRVTQSADLSRKIRAVSSGIMLGVGLFWVLPNISRSAGVAHSSLSVAVAVAALYAIDRFVYPVCPCCSQHAHSCCDAQTQALLPLVIAIGLHNLFDGWTAGVAVHAGSMAGSGIATGLVAHKVPEAMVFGMMLRSASRSVRALWLSAFATSSCIVAGFAMRNWLVLIPTSWIVTLSMTVACASFVFVGVHLFQRQRQESGMRWAVVALMVGIAGTVVVERGVALVVG